MAKSTNGKEATAAAAAQPTDKPVRSWLMQQGKDIWIEKSATRPKHAVERGTKTIRAVCGPANDEELKSVGDRMVTQSNARWRE